MSEKWKAWWKAAGIRAIKTMAETAIATIGAAAVLSAVEWPMAIKAISEKEGVDVDIASRMYAQQQGWTGWEKEMNEWNDIQRSYMKSKTKTLADLFK